MPATKKAKRPRLARDDQPGPSTRISLTNLPVEILAEILLCTCSPPTVLAVSRTCSFLYRILAQNSAASFIWRGVRKTCEPVPLPDPGDLWKKSEADYAAFVFGGGVCEVCRKNTRAMYSSFATRIRLCGSWHCRRTLLDEHLINATEQQRESLWVPYVESNRCFYSSKQRTANWPYTDSILLRKTDLEQFQHDLTIFMDEEQVRAACKRTDGLGSLSEKDKRRERIMERCNAAVQRFPAIMELSVRLVSWKAAYDRVYKIIKQENRGWTKHLAKREGWNLEDLVASQTYGSLQRRKNYLLEMIEPNDVSPIRSAIDSELVAMQAHRKRQKAEETYKENLTEIKNIYERMRCRTLEAVTGTSDSNDPLVLPPMSVFCTLPSVRVLKGSPDPSTVPPKSTPATSEIKSSPLVMSLITSDIRTWLVPVRKHLMRLLGYPNGWQSASTLRLSPLERFSARFFCRKCGEGQVGRRYQRELCLDFKGVCSHVCKATGRKSIEGRRQEVPQEGDMEATDTGDEDGQEERKGKGRKKKGVKTPNWSVDLFEKDEKAIRLIKTVLSVTGLSEEITCIDPMLRSPHCPVIRCMTCKGWIVMDIETAIGHAHRHESMQIQVLLSSAPNRVECSKTDASAPTANAYPIISETRLQFERGTSELLLGPSYRASNLCKKVNYGCKHCLLVEGRNVVVDGFDMPEFDVDGKGVRAMSFNGLRSHVKEKHGIRDIRDGDFFCYTSIRNGDHGLPNPS